MKAMTYTEYGTAEVLSEQDIVQPNPSATEVLVQVNAFSLNPEEMHMMHGMFAVRPITGMRRPKSHCLKGDVAGVVTAVGAEVSDFKLGDEVFGRANEAAQAAYVCVPQERLALKPENLSFEQAAAAPLAAITALQAVVKNGGVKKGMRVLVNGASGGIGTFAVQVAKNRGAHVTAVCSATNHDLVLGLGADVAVDYNTMDFTKSGGAYDLIVDLVGNRSLRDLRSCLAESGKCLMIGFSKPSSMFRALIGGPISSIFNRKKVGVMMASFSNADLKLVAKHLEAEILIPVIDTTYSFENTATAMKHLATGRAKGKIVIRLNSTVTVCLDG